MFNRDSGLIQPFNWLLTSKYKRSTLPQNEFLKIINKRSISQATQSTSNNNKKGVVIGAALGLTGCAVAGYTYYIAKAPSNPSVEQGQQQPGQPDKPLILKLKDLPFGAKVLLFGGAVGVFFGLNAVVLPFFLPVMSKYGKIPFVSSTPAQVQTVFDLIPKEIYTKVNTPTFVDLGSGDGRLVIEAAKRGFNATGYEINPWLVWLSKRKAQAEGVDQNCHFAVSNFWTVDLSKSDVVTVFGVEGVMERLATKFENELRPGTYVVSNIFRLPKWKPLDMKQDLWLYSKKASNK